MGATRDFVAATMADALLPAFRRPVEDIIYETLDHRQVPTRTDFKEIRDLINNLRGQVSGATSGVKKLAGRMEGSADQLDAIEARLTRIEARLDAAEHAAEQAAADSLQREARLAALEARAVGITAEQLEARLARLSPRPAAAAAPLQVVSAHCKVPDCKELARARGFCARHYQKWRRGTLRGFVSLDGTVEINGKPHSVAPKLVGEPYTISDGEVLVGGVSVALV